MDQESKDANSLLVELDKGLKSINIGDQREAVERFTNLIQRYPLPILINSACLKLTEAFRCGSNFIRVHICEIFEKNQSHLNKIYNVDDFYRNIFTVTTSNDPIARSITLLTLGNIAPIVSEYKSIHHCIISSLESTIDCELNSTIACASRYVKESSEFACNIYPKIISIIKSDKTTTEVKIRALSVLDHGFYNANDAIVVRTFLIDVINNSNLKRLIGTCLTLSTKIAYTSLTLINSQIELLLKTFKSESRVQIKLCSIKNMEFLAEKCPHIWQTEHIEPLVSYLEESLDENCNLSELENQDRILCTILSIFCKILTCKCNFISEEEKSRIFQKCHKLALDANNAALCSMAFELLTVMSEEHLHSSTDNMIEFKPSGVTSDIFAAIKSFLTKATSRTKSPSSKSDTKRQQIDVKLTTSRVVYRHIVKLCKLNRQFCPDLLKLVFSKISSKEVNLNELCSYVTEFMCAIVPLTSEPVISLENCWKTIKAKSSEMSDTNLLNLCILYFQINKQLGNHNINTDLANKVLLNRSMWLGFKVMRQAMRYGHYEISKFICQNLHKDVTTDTMDFYFSSLGRICEAEYLIVNQHKKDSNLLLALPIYEESISPLRASIGNSRTTDFQLQYLWLRIRTLHAHCRLRQCCKIFEVNPISYKVLLSVINQSQNDNLGYMDISIVQQLPKIAKEFRSIADCYENLSTVSFNCDNNTLDYLCLLKCSCTIMADSIDAVFKKSSNIINKLPVLTIPNSERPLEQRELEKLCSELIDLIQTEVVRPGLESKDDSIEPLVRLLKTFSLEMQECIFVYPRYFFQPLQMTQIKLAISPQPTTPAGIITLFLNENLVLKVEGLIQNFSKCKNVNPRQISKVYISVSMTSTKPNEPNYNINVQAMAEPHENYFKSEFLLPLKWLGSFTVDIDISVIDQQERLWKTGPTEKLNLQIN